MNTTPCSICRLEYALNHPSKKIQLHGLDCYLVVLKELYPADIAGIINEFIAIGLICVTYFWDVGVAFSPIYTHISPCYGSLSSSWTLWDLHLHGVDIFGQSNLFSSFEIRRVMYAAFVTCISCDKHGVGADIHWNIKMNIISRHNNLLTNSESIIDTMRSSLALLRDIFNDCDKQEYYNDFLTAILCDMRGEVYTGSAAT
jgi:hypothetical protein